MANHQYNPLVEVWKDICGFPGYQVSDQGRVRSFWKGTGIRCFIDKYPQRIMKQNIHAKKYGYFQVCLKIKGKVFALKVHKLVLLAFIGPCPLGYQCRHSDGNGRNNHLPNLSWGTPKDNQADRIIHGTYFYGENHHNAKLNLTKICKIKELYHKGFFQWEIAKLFNVRQSAISNILIGKTWGHLP